MIICAIAIFFLVHTDDDDDDAEKARQRQKLAFGGSLNSNLTNDPLPYQMGSRDTTNEFGTAEFATAEFQSPLRRDTLGAYNMQGERVEPVRSELATSDQLPDAPLHAPRDTRSQLATSGWDAMVGDI